MSVHRSLRRLAIACIGTTCVVLLAGAAVGSGHLDRLGIGSLARCDGLRGFDSALWQDSVAIEHPRYVRGCMVGDLRRRGGLRGRSRAEVVALLGEPPPTGYFREYDLVYWLGPERSFVGIDSEWRVLRLDERGRVVEDLVVTD